MGSDPDQQRVAARAAARGVSGSTLTYLQAVGAGARREYATAERLLAEVQGRNPTSADLVQYRALFLCLEGRTAAAQDAVRLWPLQSKGAALDPDFTAWAADEACGLQEGVSAPLAGSSSIPGKK
ncbi:MAG: hypothetical protein DMF79_14875 [Acidobacteria bacterium]|nr:MAG: hypothetical protein DMF79_14875 [Acidobacteriota bacterium]